MIRSFNLENFLRSQTDPSHLQEIILAVASRKFNFDNDTINSDVNVRKFLDSIVDYLYDEIGDKRKVETSKIMKRTKNYGKNSYDNVNEAINIRNEIDTIRIHTVEHPYSVEYFNFDTTPVGEISEHALKLEIQFVLIDYLSYEFNIENWLLNLSHEDVQLYDKAINDIYKAVYGFYVLGIYPGMYVENNDDKGKESRPKRNYKDCTMNKAMLIGRLGRDPELRYTTTGTSIANLRIATDESYTDRDGNKVERTEWHTVVVFQRQAENCATYLRKGSLVFVEGSLQTRKWQDQQGQDRYITEVRASRVQFLDRRGGTEADAGEGISDKQQQPRETLSDFDNAFSPKGSDRELGKAFARNESEMDNLPWDRPPDLPF